MKTDYNDAWECSNCGMMNYEDGPCRDCENEDYTKWKEREELKEEIKSELREEMKA